MFLHEVYMAEMIIGALSVGFLILFLIGLGVDQEDLPLSSLSYIMMLLGLPFFLVFAGLFLFL